MKNYARIISKLFYEPAIITPAHHGALCQLLDHRLGTVAPAKAMEDDDGDSGGSCREPAIYGRVAVVPVHGVLVAHPEDIAMSECGCDMETLGRTVDALEQNPAVTTVVYDFRTPGGSVTKVPEVGRKICASRKNTIAFTDSECCSGGIWLAAQCKRFFGTQSAHIGSVGVYIMCLDASKAMEKEGVKMNPVFAGKYKLLGAYWREMPDDERAILQALVQKIYGQFKEAMESHRIVSDRNFGNGLVFDGEEAAEIGFTDGVVDSLEDVLDNLID